MATEAMKLALPELTVPFAMPIVPFWFPGPAYAPHTFVGMSAVRTRGGEALKADSKLLYNETQSGDEELNPDAQFPFGLIWSMISLFDGGGKTPQFVLFQSLGHETPCAYAMVGVDTVRAVAPVATPMSVTKTPSRRLCIVIPPPHTCRARCFITTRS